MQLRQRQVAGIRKVGRYLLYGVLFPMTGVCARQDQHEYHLQPAQATRRRLETWPRDRGHSDGHLGRLCRLVIAQQPRFGLRSLN
jgi:hypothetical protein